MHARQVRFAAGTAAGSIGCRWLLVLERVVWLCNGELEQGWEPVASAAAVRAG